MKMKKSLLLVVLWAGIAAAFQAGIVSRSLFIPVGVPTAGYGQKRTGNDPRSPFAIRFPATSGVHTPIKVKVLILQSGEKSVSLIKLDTVGVDGNIYERMQARIAQALGQESQNHLLIMSGSHTHAGPGRLARNPFFWAAAGNYSEGLLQLLEEQIFSAWQEARNHLFKARIGFGEADLSEIIHDRRCENPEMRDTLARLIKIESAQRKLRGVIINFNIHGTVLGSHNHFFSVDAPGLIERKVEESFDHPVTAFLVQATAGDISPHSPKDFKTPWDKMEEIGWVASKKIDKALSKVKTSAELDLDFASLRVPLSREALGYKEGEFPYPYGAFLCGMAQEHCDKDYATPIPTMKSCLVQGKRYLIPATTLSGVKLNDRILLTLPGEGTTPLGKTLREELSKKFGAKKVMLWGYAQDHLGYLLLSWDWWQGGYEPSMSPWGWKLGEYLMSHSEAIAAYLLKQDPLPKSSAPPLHFKKKSPRLPKPEEAVGAGEAASEVEEKAGEVSFSWLGGDASLDFPEVVVERKEKKGWQPVKLKNGLSLTSDHYSLFLSFLPEPSYAQAKKADQRRFVWRVKWRAKRPVPDTLKLKSGKYRFTVRGKAFHQGIVSSYTLVSPSFSL